MRADDQRRAYWLALNKIAGIGSRRLMVLVQHLGSVEAAWKAEPGQLEGLAGWGATVREAFLAQRRQINPEDEYLAARRWGVHVWTLDDADYPEMLRHIPDPPVVLYARGQSWPREALALSIVGTRRATAYGRRVARQLARDLAASNVVVVSGLARGIDSEAHTGTLEAGGFTVAVLGCGIDVIYPPENAKLYETIAARGLILSEFPLRASPKPGNFPARNRIISGLARGVIVVEAGQRSGALITADHALEQCRDVFAVPGPINSPYSRGSNWLIQQGAKLVTTAADILEEYGLAVLPPAPDGGSLPQSPGHRERRILQLLAGGPVQLEELAQLSGYNITELAQLLTLLEIKGLVQQLPGKQFVAQVR